MKDTIFISHATPIDNTFAVWLSTKLELAGYKTWVDLNNLLPSTDFWNMIESTIRDRAVKFIFVTSRTSVNPLRDGIRKELSVADKVRRIADENFIIPVRIDDVSYNDLPVETIRLNAINFYNDWASGLKELFDCLIEFEVPRTCERKESSFFIQKWYERAQENQKQIVEKEEIYSSNLFNVVLPQNIYLYRKNQLVLKELSSRRIPFKLCHSVIITFACNQCVSCWGEEIDHIKIDTIDAIKIDTPKVFFEENVFNLSKDVIALVNNALGELFFSRGLCKYRADQRKSQLVYYFPIGSKALSEITNRKKSLAGIYHSEKNWHFAVSGFLTKEPTFGVLIKWHLVFTNKDGVLLSDNLQISARRSKGRLFYNKQWSELLQAAMNYFSGAEDQIKYVCCCEENIMFIDRKSSQYYSSKGYIEPSVKNSSEVLE